jgi:hypothetical protein
MQAGIVARAVWICYCEAMVDHLTEWIPLKEDRQKFVEQAVANLNNPEFHLYTTMYEKLKVILNYRHMVIGCKPEDCQKWVERRELFG